MNTTTTIANVTIVKDANGRLTFHLPTGMRKAGLRAWKKRNAEAIAQFATATADATADATAEQSLIAEAVESYQSISSNTVTDAVLCDDGRVQLSLSHPVFEDLGHVWVAFDETSFYLQTEIGTHTCRPRSRAVISKIADLILAKESADRIAIEIADAIGRGFITYEKGNDLIEFWKNNQ